LGQSTDIEPRLFRSLSRKVLVTRCPSTTTAEEVAQCFPTAESVALHHDEGFFVGLVTVTFSTADEARTAASRTDVFVGGNRVRLIWRASERMADKDRAEANLRCVYIHHCPASATEADVRRQFPTAESVIFIFRNPCRYYGTVVVHFDSTEEAQKSAKRDIKILGNRVSLTLAASKDSPEWLAREREERSRSLFIRNCPTVNVTANDLEAKIRRFYPSALSVVLNKERGLLRGAAFVRFPTVAEACDALHVNLVLCGRPMVVAPVRSFEKMGIDKSDTEQ